MSSGFLGFWVAAVALALDRTGVLSVWTTTILMSVFIADATVTLLRRVARRAGMLSHIARTLSGLARRWHGHRRHRAALGDQRRIRAADGGVVRA